MSTSYGPGRYDPAYEIDGHDYPYGHVRWTLNRNMQAYLELVSGAQVVVGPLIDRVVRVDEAPAAYDQLAKADGVLPLGVLIHYPDEQDDGKEPERGSRSAAIDSVGHQDQLRAGRRRRVRHGDARAADAKARRPLLHARRRQPQCPGQQLRARQPGRGA